jgi:hypothetical protein
VADLTSIRIAVILINETITLEAIKKWFSECETTEDPSASFQARGS